MTLTAGRAADGTGPAVTFLDAPAGGPTGLRLRGEMDMLSTDTLREAIAALPTDALEIHLELADLSFIDVYGTRVLLALARHPAPRRLILHQPPHSLVRLIRLLWPDGIEDAASPDHRIGSGATISVHPA